MSLSAAARQSLKMAQRHYENFPVASRLLPRALRLPVAAIYAFARSADDIADEGGLSAAERLAALDAYRDQLDRLARGETVDRPVFTALAEAVAAHRLPLAPFYDLLSAFRQDVVKTRYADFAELADYCSRSANPIGRLLLHLYGVDGEAPRAGSDAICTGLQLVNFLQDLRGDYARGRVYLPQDALARAGIDPRTLAGSRADGALRAVLRAEAARARGLLRSGRPLIGALPGRAAWELRFTLAGGLRVLEKFDAGLERGRLTPARLRPWDWVILSARVLRPGGLP